MIMTTIGVFDGSDKSCNDLLIRCITYFAVIQIYIHGKGNAGVLDAQNVQFVLPIILASFFPILDCNVGLPSP